MNSYIWATMSVHIHTLATVQDKKVYNLDGGKKRSEWIRQKLKQVTMFSGRCSYALINLCIVFLHMHTHCAIQQSHLLTSHLTVCIFWFTSIKHERERSNEESVVYSWDVCRCYCCIHHVTSSSCRSLKRSTPFLWHRYIFWFACVMLKYVH